jgi:hypothetical protein
MLPSRQQYRKWSLPTRWSFVAAVIGVPVGVVSLALTALPLVCSDGSTEKERARLLLQTAQELRYNHVWLSAVAIAHAERVSTIPTGSVRSKALISLIQREHGKVIEGAYGEQKHVYQLALRLEDLGTALGSPKTSSQLAKFNRRSDYTLHDIHFLNNFLFWYMSPLLIKEVEEAELYSLGWSGLPNSSFRIDSLKRLAMKHFLDEGAPITEYQDYLGRID